METVTIDVVDAETNETIHKTLEVVRAEAPSIKEDEKLVEWWEMTNTQYIQHWAVEPDNINDSEALNIIKGE